MSPNTKKFALVHLGNDMSYGLTFVAGELIKHGHEIKWFDGDGPDFVSRISAWKPGYACFSPLSTFFDKSEKLALKVKSALPNVTTVFGGVTRVCRTGMYRK